MPRVGHVHHRVDGDEPAGGGFTRLYLIPAGYHCLFGPEPGAHPSEIGVPEFLQPLMDWVERGTAPAVINVPTVNGDATEVIRDLDVAPFGAAVGENPQP